jgi:hypothetical protein
MGPHATTVRLGPRALGLMLPGLITPCGMVLNSHYPYPGARKPLRRFTLLWWRKFEFSGGGSCRPCMLKGRSPSVRTWKVWSPVFGNLLCKGHAVLMVTPYRVGLRTVQRLRRSSTTAIAQHSGSPQVSVWCDALLSLVPLRWVAPFSSQEWWGYPWYGVYGSLVILLLEEPVISRLSGCNWWPVVPGVQDPDSCPRAFHRSGGQSWPLDGWQHRYSHDTARTTMGFRNMITGPKASMIRFWNPAVVPTM